MHITLESDYAVRIVYCLAREGSRMDAASISEQTGVTLRFALKILRKLAVGAIVNSFKGSGGGYELAAAPDQISMRQVVEAVEGTYMLSRCLGDGYMCSHAGGDCPFVKVYEEISETVRRKLDEVNFAEMIIKENHHA